MKRSATYSFVELEVSQRAYTEIRAKLAAADYDHAFLAGKGGEMIDMHGLALRALPPPPPQGTLIVGLTEKGDEVVINHPDLLTNEKGEGHIVFSPNQARELAVTLVRKAAEAEQNGRDSHE